MRKKNPSKQARREKERQEASGTGAPARTLAFTSPNTKTKSTSSQSIADSGDETDSVAPSPGLSVTKHCDTPENLASIIGSIVGDKLAYSHDKTIILAQQFGTYFGKLGWLEEETMSSAAGQTLPKPQILDIAIGSVGLISPAVRLVLQNIATYTATVRKRKLYLSKSIQFDELESYHFSNCYAHQRRYDAAALGNGQTPSGGSDQKIPAFTVPKFDGSTLEGEVYVNNVERKFKGNGQLQYLEDDKYCNDHLPWSEAFSSRILDSLASSDILGYMSTELKDERNCAVVWDKICSCLQTSDLTMQRIMKQWYKNIMVTYSGG